MFAAVLLVSLDGLRSDTSLVPTLDLARISYLAALDLEGRVVRVSFTCSSLPCDFGNGFVVEADGPDHQSRMVWFAKGENPNWTADSHTVEGVLSVVCHQPSVHDNIRFPGFVEVKIVGARRVGAR